MNNGKRFAIRIAALMLCLMTVSASLSSCGFFADSYLENNAWTEGKVATKSENTRAETTATEEETIVEIIESPETTKTPDTTKAPETTKEPETTSAPETTLSPEQLDNIPDDVQENVYLSHMNSGRCEMLIGKVNLTVIMVSDDVSVWNEAAIGELSSSLKLQEKQIEELAASYGKVLDITFSFLGSKIAGDAAAGEHSTDWINEAAKSVGYSSINSMQTDLDSRSGADSNPVLFALNKAGRAYAQQRSSTLSAEYFVLFSSDYSAFNHELYHLYGAYDYYYPTEVKELADTYLKDSIMQAGKITDPLTAFVIGWDDEMDAEAYDFLKKTAHITQSYLNTENSKQMKTGEVTGHDLGYGIYTGYLERGVPDGYGELTYTSGDSYKGYFDGGRYHGEGTYTWVSGNVFVGNWEQGKRTGYGVTTFAEGTVYEGNWENDTYNGHGKMTWPDGAYYEGNYKDGNRHGKGSYYFANGNVYIGDWVEGERTGKGTLTWASGDMYVGDFVLGQFEGKGVYTSAEGYKYDGSWKEGKRNGYGVATWADGGRYEGNWLNDQLHGQGKQKYSNGTVYEGNYSEGKQNGQGTMVYANGDVYSGEWKDGKFNGTGRYIYARGHEYYGEWSNSTYSGQGYMKWADGSSYEGQWKNSQRHGYGKYVNQYGQVFEGQWKNDVFQG